MNRISNDQDFIFITSNYSLRSPPFKSKITTVRTKTRQNNTSLLHFLRLKKPAMSRKQNQKDSSGFIFDLQSNTVLAQGGAFENMKEKVCLFTVDRKLECLVKIKVLIKSLATNSLRK